MVAFSARKQSNKSDPEIMTGSRFESKIILLGIYITNGED